MNKDRVRVGPNRKSIQNCFLSKEVSDINCMKKSINRGSPVQFSAELKSVFPLLLHSITAADYGAGAVDDRDLTVSSDHTPLGLPFTAKTSVYI